MDFQHTEDRRMLADTLDRFVAEQYPFPTRDKVASSSGGYSKDFWKRFADLGAVGALFDEEAGGLGGNGFDITVVFESLGKGLVVEPFLDALIVGQALSRDDSDASRAVVANLIDGTCLVSFAHEEPDSHYQLSKVSCRAKLASEEWILKGVKAVVQNGSQTDFLLVSARTDGNDDAEDGISLFLVPRNTLGVHLRDYPKIDGGRAAELLLDDVRVPAGALVGARGEAFAVLERAIGLGVLALCAEAIGAMEVVKEHTLEYSRTRKQFGVPIGSFQALQHRMVDMALEIEQARSAVINAAAALYAERIVREQALSAAKYTIGRVGARVAEEGIQLHGGIGMTHELPLSHYAKRLIMIDHQLGDEDHHLQRYMAFGGLQ